MRRLNKKGRIILAVVLGLVALNIVTDLALLLVPSDYLANLKERPYSTVYYDSQQQLLQVTSLPQGGRREKLESREITRLVKKVFIKAEDKRFYFHHGADYTALLSAVWQNIRGKQIVRGGSTITMQLVKMQNDDNSLTVRRKLHDIFYACVIEAKHTKKTIFEVVNTLYIYQI